MHPFESDSSRCVSAWGERRLIDAIRGWLGEASPPPPAGIGDDCAVLTPSPGAKLLVTTDPVVWNRHFDDSCSPEAIAGKLLKRNVSDIAAMGGRPRSAVVSLLLSPNTSIAWLERFYRGLRDCAMRYDTPVAGGDVSAISHGTLAASLTLLGESVDGHILTRGGARPGDTICVTGTLGGSLLGRHLSFEPRLREGQWLASRPEVTAAIDLSDGLAKDLPGLLPSGCVADLAVDRIPISDDAKRAAATSGRTSLEHALSDGEDYELLITVNGEQTRELLQAWRATFSISLTPIGVIAKRESGGHDGETIRGLPACIAERIQGYEHFR